MEIIKTEMFVGNLENYEKIQKILDRRDTRGNRKR